jgi:LPS-assembly protein
MTARAGSLRSAARAWARAWAGALSLAALAAVAWPGPAAAQGQAAATGTEAAAPATLIADAIRFDQNAGTVRATGAVEIFYEGARLRAAEVFYDGRGDRVRVTGPLTLTEANGRTVILADYAELGTDLQEGVLRSARLVLGRQLQIAANEIERSDGRYTQAFRTVASSCEVCADNPTPLWEIRAARVIHDQFERQIYFDNATFHVMGLPVAYLPRLRLPDPTLERATGFLAPSFRLNDNTGTHLRLPYFITLGRHADVTLTPWIGSAETRTVELRYRQAFRRGTIDLDAALSDDDLLAEDPRGYLSLAGAFDLPRGFGLRLEVNGVTDRAYFSDYGFPDSSLLESYVEISRTRRDEYIAARASSYASLREGDDNETLPTQVIDAEILRRFVPRGLGGIATVGLQGFGYYRLADQDGVNGRDVARLSGSLDWRRDAILPGGLRAAVQTALYADIYNTAQGAALTGTQTRLSPFVGLELRYPLARTSARGVSHVIEPIVQLAWSETRGGAVPIEDSRIVEFDEANLFSLDRFPGQDQREVGRRANIGLAYTRRDPLGWSLGVVGGMVIRDRDHAQFTQGSGLDGMASDFLLATHAGYGDRWQIVNRALFDEGLTFTSNELFLSWRGEDHALETSYTWLEADIAEGRPRDTSEWALDAAYTLRDNWQAGVDWRYDFVEAGPTRAGLELSYVNECVDMALSVSRRFTTSTTVNPVTEVGLTISLNGFGTGRSGRSAARSCLR